MAAKVSILRILAASPSDVHDERERLNEVVEELNADIAKKKHVKLELVRWETHARPGVGDDAQDVINKQMPSPDVFVGVLWKRFGSPTKRADSGTVEEFETAYKDWKGSGRPEILFYFSRKPHFPDSLEDIAQLQKILEFRVRLQEAGVFYWFYDSIDQFAADVRRHLTDIILNRRQRGGHRPTNEELSASKSQIRGLQGLQSALSVTLHSEPLTSLIYADLDGFGRVNESAGTEQGDRILARVAEVLRDVMRGKGGMFRIGGDEFVAVLPNSTLDEAAATARRITQEVRTIELSEIVRISVGVSSTTDSGSDGAALLKNARDSMVVSKTLGGDRVTVHPLTTKERAILDKAEAHLLS